MGVYIYGVVISVFTFFMCYEAVRALDCKPCECTEDTMECKWKSLDDIPSYIPYDTKILRLFRNNIPVLKNDSFLTLQKLDELYLTGNRIQTIETHGFRGLTQLKILKLDQNEIDGLPPLVFSSLTKLEKLDLSFNYITQLSAQVFLHLDSLKEIDLSGNRISALGREAFSYMPSIQILHMNENIMQHISAGTFQDLASLREVHLRNNEIKTLAPNAFSNTSIVKTIDLSGSNQITYLHGDTFRYLSKLETLKLDGNPFMCSCELYGFREWMDTVASVNWYTENLPVCELPEMWKGQNLFTIELTSFVCTTTMPTTTTTTVTTTTEAPTTTTTAMRTTTTVEESTPNETTKSVKTPVGTTSYRTLIPSASTSVLDSDYFPIIIGCSCAALVLIIIIIIVCICCRKCQKQQADSGIYKVRENNISHDHIRPSNHVRFENEMNDKTDSKMSPSNGKIPNGKVNNENGNLSYSKLPNGNTNHSTNGHVPNGHVPNGNSHIQNGALPNHIAKKNLLNEYNNEGYTDVIDTSYTPEKIFHTDSSLNMSHAPIMHSNNPDYNKNIANLKRDYDHQPDISYHPGGSSAEDMESRPSQRSSSRSSPTLNSSSGLLPAWDYPPLDNYEPSLCSISSNNSKKIRTETYV